ncbi:site-specific integrase [Dyadobacter chenwenxiniae]|uniref:Site-specific integrase n=1 Tax=Dyadobacter chenwenxiniae TaxID=2906456 RepID=A0A9X1TCN0_9BACT|nr:site-specific integrase [Dyadobacter chenwenxiniae]MCF0059874.1 site-specific integrase [Dyadobacter chenwenxiniae]UON85614.1 site-specific integrase [Dyadobacter chenwenxiniae]
MLTKSFTLLFYLKKRSNYVKGKLPIYMRLTVDGKRIEVATKRECEPTKWNSAAGRVAGNREEVKSINSYLDVLQSKVYDLHRKMIESEITITAELFKNKLVNDDEKKKMILEIFEKHNCDMASLVGTEYSKITLVRYKTSLEHTRNFIKWKYNLNDFSIQSLDYDFIAQYEFWLKTQRRCGHNATMKYLANFKKIVLSCVKKGWLGRDPFYGFKFAKREVDRSALSERELEKISLKEFDNVRLDQVRDIFLFCCYTGLSYVDVFKLQRSEVIEGHGGELWITIKRQKTETSSRVPILPAARKILQKYESHPQCSAKGQLLPVLSNQKMNAYLKEIADVCQVNKNITFHLARHTFATTVTLTNGVPMESVSKMLGHRNIRTTQLYAKIVDKKISEDMKKIESLYS